MLITNGGSIYDVEVNTSFLVDRFYYSPQHPYWKRKNGVYAFSICYNDLLNVEGDHPFSKKIKVLVDDYVKKHFSFGEGYFVEISHLSKVFALNPQDLIIYMVSSYVLDGKISELWIYRFGLLEEGYALGKEGRRCKYYYPQAFRFRFDKKIKGIKVMCNNIYVNIIG